MALALLVAHNAARARAGKSLLVLDLRLTAAAQAHADRMAALRRMAHQGIGDGDPWRRMQAAGYAFSAASENIAEGQRGAAEVVAAWLADPPHRVNVLGDFVHLGGGMAVAGDGTPYWCCDYATPA